MVITDVKDPIIAYNIPIAQTSFWPFSQEDPTLHTSPFKQDADKHPLPRAKRGVHLRMRFFPNRRNPMPPSSHLLPLSLLLSLVLLCSDSLGVEGFEPLIKIPRSRRGHSLQANVSISVDGFGAKGDGITDDTQAFANAWSFACSSRSRPVLEIPSGNVYLVRPVDFTGHCRSRITLLVSGTIIAPSDPDEWKGLDPRRWIYFHGINNLEIRGGGTIDGSGKEWWARSCKRNATNPCRHAPTAVTFHRLKRLTIHDLTFKDSQQMHMAFTNCSRVTASHLNVMASANSPNTDGIHISASHSIVLEDSVIQTGDDCISIVSNSSKIMIKNITCGPGHGISIGSLGKWGSWAEVHNVWVDGAFISNTENGLRIKTWQGGRGHVRNIVFRNIVMENVSNPIIIDQFYCDSPNPCQNQTSAVKVEGISFVGISGTSATKEAIKFACSDEFPCKNIVLQDIQLALDCGEEAAAYCWNASGFSTGIVHPPSCLSSPDECIKQNVSSSIPLYATAR